MENKFTDNEIMKALECFKSEDCLGKECPYFEMPGLCGKKMCIDVYDFIYRKKAENERLQAENVKLHTIIPKMIITAKAEAIKEFAERVKEKQPLFGMDTVHGRFNWGIRDYEIDDLVKEMEGADE